MAIKFCPGAANICGTPTLKIKNCPECGGEIELFSTDTQANCPGCGLTVYNDILSCIRWCAHARECVGEEMYEKLMHKKTNNHCRKIFKATKKPGHASPRFFLL